MSSNQGHADSTPSARPSMSTPSDQGPLALFDLYLRILSDSYLTFLQERRKVEEDYYESLMELHRKTLNVDQFFDSRLESTSLRSAWSEVRDNLEREAQTRRAFMDSITHEVINPLVSFKETQERIRKRIRGQMKLSIQTHNDYTENVLPKLKRAYIKKCQDVEDHKSVALSAASHAKSDLRYADSQVRDPTTRPIVTSPQPLRPLERRASTSTTSTRPRSPPTAFSDIASQGKKQLNQLITFLDKGSAKEALRGGSDRDPLRSVRAKREADEADVQYRNAVHWCETLRLNREKTIQAGYHSLETFIGESSETIKQALGKYADNLAAMFSTSLQLANHGAQQVEKVSTLRDMKGVNAYIAQSLASSIPSPIPYHNFYVGECRDLIFGFSLQDYATARDLPEGEIPKIVRICIEEVDKRGLDAEGIYRVSGRVSSVNELRHRIEKNEKAFSFYPTDDIYVVAALLKMYLRELPEPLLKFPLEDRIQHTIDFEKHFASDFQLVRAKIRRLPPIHRYTLKAVLSHLNRVASNRERNKMDTRNLAIVFGIFGIDDDPKGGDLLSLQGHNDTFMEALIIHCHTIFDEQIHTASYASSPPLPPAPLGETAPPYAYGSTHTKFSERAPQQFNAPLPQTPTPQTTGDDFTPQVPPQPPASIHPSSRGNAGSSSGHPNTSPISSEAETNAETNVSSPTSYIAPPPLPLRPGRQSVTVQSLRGTKGLDFSQPEISEGDWTGPAPASPPLSDPPSPLPTPSALSLSTERHSLHLPCQLLKEQQLGSLNRPTPPLKRPRAHQGPMVSRRAKRDLSHMMNWCLVRLQRRLHKPDTRRKVTLYHRSCNRLLSLVRARTFDFLTTVCTGTFLFVSRVYVFPILASFVHFHRSLDLL
ncbi:RhoGAP-domain-containing protein [Thelephora terrestris]|uniref:RhoGAP-domain-containing protein n=1 Tax=Thelephora terrestris TaxID=56493 RepID=A0A9P6HG11_9AGAM|nr:RhoGAP-domain-containing protein [Thelephora terrestris]